MTQVTVLFDEACRFCAWLAHRLARVPGITAAPIGSLAGSLLLRDLSPAERYTSVHVVDEHGRRWSGGAALPPLLRRLPGGGAAASLAEALPGVTDRLYRLVARHRSVLSKLLCLLRSRRRDAFSRAFPGTQSTESRSTTNTSGSCGAITPPAPRAP